MKKEKLHTQNTNPFESKKKQWISINRLNIAGFFGFYRFEIYIMKSRKTHLTWLKQQQIGVMIECEKRTRAINGKPFNPVSYMNIHPATPHNFILYVFLVKTFYWLFGLGRRHKNKAARIEKQF